MGGAPERFLDALVVSAAVMPTAAPASAGDLGGPGFPWLVDIRGPDPVVNVFTSAELLTAAGYPLDRSVSADFVAIAAAWPDTRFGLAVNPGSAIATLFPGTEVVRLTEWARAVAHRAEQGAT